MLFILCFERLRTERIGDWECHFSSEFRVNTDLGLEMRLAREAGVLLGRRRNTN